MKNIVLKVLGYILLRNAFFYFSLPFISSKVKGLKLSDLKNHEDWFMFSWLFLLPAIIEAVVFTFPFSYGLNKIEIGSTKLNYYLLFFGLIVVEYVILNMLNAVTFIPYKVGISVLLFMVLFRKYLF